MKANREIAITSIILLLVTLPLSSVSGTVYNVFYIQALPISAEIPKVILQQGTAGTSTIYTSNTSAKVSVAAAVWLSGWNKRVRITIDHNDVSSVLSDFPVLIYLSSSSGRDMDDVTFVFDEVGSNSKKIAVTTGDRITQCYVEIEKWDAANKKAWLWVKVSSISNTADTDLYLYYDNSHADNTVYVGDPGSTPAQNVWDSNFKGVWHLEEDPAGTAPQMKDSTSNGNNGTSYGTMTTSDQVAGKIDGSLDFDGSNDEIQCGNGASLQITTELTIEAWAKTSSTGGIVNKQVFTSPYNGYQLRKYSDNKFRFAIGNPLSYYAASDSAYTDSDWHYIVGVRRSGTNYLYVDGVQQAQTFSQSITDSGNNFDIGRAYVTYNGYWWNGQIDEVRVSNTGRSAAWIKAAYETERDDLVAYEKEEEYDYVDNSNSNVDSSANKGTHSNFTAQQYGPDSIYDILTEQDTGGGDANGTRSPSSYANKGFSWTENGGSNSAYSSDNGYAGQTSTNNRGCDYLGFGFDIPSGSTINGIEVSMEGHCTGGSSSPYKFSAQLIKNGAKVGNEKVVADDYGASDTTQTVGSSTDLWGTSWTRDDIVASNFGVRVQTDTASFYPGTMYLDHVYIKVYYTLPPNYELDLEVQWTSVDYNEVNEQLCIYGATMASEDIRVDVWNGSAWKNVFTDLTSGWNNVSVSSYLVSSTFTIRFKGGTETGDTTPSSWYIDATLLHVWASYDFVLRVVNQVAASWKVNLKVYDSFNIGRLSSAKISLHDGTISNQIIVSGGVITQSEGPQYDLLGNATIYISINNLWATTSGTSRLFVYLKIQVPNISTYNLFVITFEIT